MTTPFLDKVEWIADCAVFIMLLVTVPIWIWFYAVFKICKKIWSFI